MCTYLGNSNNTVVVPKQGIFILTHNIIRALQFWEHKTGI
ncbi:protein of unknown function [Ruminococcaceae bacterium BL-4]|nr:protein of unknown function [Ruminococcaceae bacterium BL-4]